MSDVTIYALVDPRDNEVRYIGQSKDVSTRYTNLTGSNPAVQEWFMALRSEGLKPIIHSLEAVSYHDADARERFYIQKGLDEGLPLLNRMYTPSFNARRPARKEPAGSRFQLMIDPNVLDEVKELACQEHRSISNMIVKLLIDVLTKRSSR